MPSHHHILSTLCIGGALVVASCAGSSATPGTGPARSDLPDATQPDDTNAATGANSDTTTDSTEDSTGDDSGVPERPEPVAIGDLSEAPFITFAPIGPRPRNRPDSPFPDGSADYWDLFVDGAPWTAALAEVDAVKIHSWQAREHFSDRELIDMIDFLARHEIPLVVEMEPLQPPNPAECDHTESYEGPLELRTAEKIERLGGVIAAVAIEQPYSFAHKLTGEGACEYSVERITDELIVWVSKLRNIFPDVVVGSIEGIWADPETTPDDMATWLDGYEAALGEPLAFLHMDTNWNRADWVDAARGIEAVAEARGVPFGLLYNGGLSATNDEWLQFTAERVADFEANGGGTPTHVTFQSWVDQPDRVLPETDPSAFTHLINRYLGVRPDFVEVTVESDSIAGRLVDAADAPVAGLEVEAALRSQFDQPNLIEFAGRVPAGATDALIVLRVSAEDASPGAIDGQIYEISYTEPDGVERVINGDFAEGDRAWGGDPTNEGITQYGTGDDGRPALLAQAATGEAIYLNSESFPVTAGEDFTLRVEAAVSDVGDATPSGQVAVAFLTGEREAGRRGVDLLPPFNALTPTLSDAEGRFAIDLGGLDPSGVEVRLSTPGDVATWPASQLLTAP